VHEYREAGRGHEVRYKSSMLKAAFDLVPVSVVVLDENALICYTNKTALSLINKEQGEVLGRHFGDSFNCTGSYKSERGCGNGPMCTDCEIRKAVSAAFETGQTTEGIELNKQLFVNGRETDFWFKASVTPIVADNRTNAVVTLLDITDKKKEELSLIQSINFSTNILDQIPAIVWKINTNLKCEYVNKGWEEFTGIGSDRVLGNSPTRIIHPDDLHMCSIVINEASIKRESFQMEARLYRNDGEYRSCLFAGTPYYNLDGFYDGYIGSIIDITESKKVIESLNRYQNLAEITDDIILFIDLDGRIVDANNAAVKAYGYTYEELCSLNIRDIRADWHYTEKQMDTANRSGIFFEAVHRRKDGSCFDVEVSSRGAALDNKRILTSIVRDITERKMAEKRLREQEELFRTVFEQAPIGIVYGNNDKHILKVNPKFEEITGRSKEELTTLSWTDYTHPNDIQKDLDSFKKFRAGKIDGYSMVKRYIRPDGSIVWINFNLAPMKVGDQSESAHICMIENMTERIQAETDMQESERSKAVLLSNLPGMAYRCNYDREWTMQFVSDGCYDLTGYKAESLLHNKELSFNDLINSDYQEYLWEKWAELLPRKGIFKEEYSITTASGELKWVYEQGRGIYDDNGNVVALEGLIIDITDRKRKEDEIRYLNYHDVLTGLYNRRQRHCRDRLIRRNQLQAERIRTRGQSCRVQQGCCKAC
jgi:PAS domain S-box-containing protein